MHFGGEALRYEFEWVNVWSRESPVNAPAWEQDWGVAWKWRTSSLQQGKGWETLENHLEGLWNCRLPHPQEFQSHSDVRLKNAYFYQVPWGIWCFFSREHILGAMALGLCRSWAGLSCSLGKPWSPWRKVFSRKKMLSEDQHDGGCVENTPEACGSLWKHGD